MYLLCPLYCVFTLRLVQTAVTCNPCARRLQLAPAAVAKCTYFATINRANQEVTRAAQLHSSSTPRAAMRRC